MPTYSHRKPGVLNTSARVEVKDGFVQNGEAVIEILQPANSLVTNAYFRQIDAAAFATNTSVGVELGLTSSSNEIASDASDAVLDEGTAIPANFILELKGDTAVTWNGGYSVGDASGPAVPAGDAFSAVERTIFFTVTCTDDVCNTQGKYEVIVDFQIFS